MFGFVLSVACKPERFTDTAENRWKFAVAWPWFQECVWHFRIVTEHIEFQAMIASSRLVKEKVRIAMQGPRMHPKTR
jgi:hypothetical protein